MEKKKYQIIVQYIEDLINHNNLKEGDKLPSIRKMTEIFECNKATIIRGYKELELNHRIYSIPKGGYYTIGKKDFNSKATENIDFSQLIPDNKLLPYKEFNHCVNKAIEKYKDELFSYSHPQGLYMLRKTLVNHLQQYHIHTTEDKICITAGAQQALSILVNMPFPNGKETILVEQPTYSIFNRLVALSGKRLVGITRNNDGIDLKRLEEIFKKEDIKFFYTIPRLHNPLGTSYPEKTKKEIAGLASKYDVYVVEDDYLVDIDINKRALPVKCYDKDSKIIYVKSFSKAFLPGIRIGGIVLGKEVIEEFVKHKRCQDLNTSALSQGALEIYISSGMYKKHILKVKAEYKRKMRLLADILNKYSNGGVEVFTADVGLFVWFKLPKEIDVTKLVKNLKNNNVITLHPKTFYFEGYPQDNSIRLCIGNLTDMQIRLGIIKVLEEIETEGRFSQR